jgi:hypothetical protein
VADDLTAELGKISDREQAATPGPWGWFGNTDAQSIYLATKRWGRFTVMGFRRWGMNSARPVFAVGRTWKPGPQSGLDFGAAGRMAPADVMLTRGGELEDADKMPVYAVAPSATDRSDPRVYRADLAGIRNADAEFIAGAREDVPRLLAAVEAALAEAAKWKRLAAPGDAQDECADNLRQAITRELLGEDASGG